jgi:cytochrome c oxidase subunit II
VRTWARAASLAPLCSACAQQGATVQGREIHNLFVTITWMAVPVFVIVELTLLFMVFRYRKRDDEAAPQRFGSSRTLVLFFAIPTVIVAVLYGFGESTLAKVQRETNSPEVVIRVEGFQWEWTFYYVNEGFFNTGKTLTKPAVMEVPVDAPVHIELVSRDVIHSFFVPSFLFKRDVIPGRTNEFTFTATKLGTYNGQCAEFCGLYHSKMTFTLNVVTEPDYLAWVQAERKAALNVTCPVGSNTVNVTAHNISWNTACIAVNAGAPVSLTVDNQDAGIDHNFAIYNSAQRTHRFFQTGRFAGVATQSFNIAALPPGKYYFQCDVHGPAMSGTFIVAKPSG